jgi:predicted kinase
MPKCYQLIGVPGSGKSTWVDKQAWAFSCVKVSTDKWVELYAKEVGLTYSKVFTDFMPTAIGLMVEEVIAARELNRDIIWDQTSTTIKSRKKKFLMLPDYHAIAVVFKPPSTKELEFRLNNRPGKIVPKHVVQSMIDNWEEPTIEEGFKDIWYV